MKKRFLSILLIGYFIGLKGQYDFPIVMHGISISLDANGQRTVLPEMWLLDGFNDCYTDSLLISSTSFPRMAVPPTSASDQWVFDCNNASSESIEIWWKGLDGVWLVADSYVVINGFEHCNCTLNCPSIANPILVNGYSCAFEADRSISIHARELVAAHQYGFSYSFGPESSDSIRVFNCNGEFTRIVSVYAHAEGLESGSAQTYITIDTSACETPNNSNQSPRVIQGLNVPFSASGMISVPARAFALPYGPVQQLSYSTRADDTIRSFSCADLGNDLEVRLYNHIGTNVSNVALSYIVKDNGRLFCGSEQQPFAINDALSEAKLVNECWTFDHFNTASLDPTISSIDNLSPLGGDVWYKFPRANANGEALRLSINPLDSIYYGLYTSRSSGQLNNLFEAGLLTKDSTIIPCWESEYFDYWYLRIQQSRPNSNCRYFLHTAVETSCDVSTHDFIEESAITVFPNPSNSLFHLRNTSHLAIEEVRLHEVAGKLLFSQSEPKIDLTDFPSGIYWLSIRLKNGQQISRKIVKQ